MNHVVSLILTKSILRHAYTDAGLEEIVIKCVSTRVDQLHRYLAALEDSILSKFTDPLWVSVVSHVTKVGKNMLGRE